MKDALHSLLQERDLVAEIDPAYKWSCIGIIHGGETLGGRARYLRILPDADRAKTVKCNARPHALIKISVEQAVAFFEYQYSEAKGYPVTNIDSIIELINQIKL